ncbi:hypothetical protein [Achromobacter animicus]|uniref:hypothetical protein n=1 Tax=Achromobacter animicus TaxID=1389935 RepID=UPI001FE9C90C|nr:hypothetical protein [Achromobacter animicus]
MLALSAAVGLLDEHPATTATKNNAAPQRLIVNIDIFPALQKRYSRFYSKRARGKAC